MQAVEIEAVKRCVGGCGGRFSSTAESGDVISRLNAAAVDVMGNPTARARLADLGIQFPPREKETPEALAAFQKAEIEKWWPIIKEFGIKAE